MPKLDKCMLIIHYISIYNTILVSILLILCYNTLIIIHWEHWLEKVPREISNHMGKTLDTNIVLKSIVKYGFG